MTQQTFGFIGLGNMGAPMAAHLIKAGHALVVCDNNDAAAAVMTAQGAKRVATPAQVEAGIAAKLRAAERTQNIPLLLVADPDQKSRMLRGFDIGEPRGPMLTIAESDMPRIHTLYEKIMNAIHLVPKA